MILLSYVLPSINLAEYSLEHLFIQNVCGRYIEFQCFLGIGEGNALVPRIRKQIRRLIVDGAYLIDRRVDVDPFTPVIGVRDLYRCVVVFKINIANRVVEQHTD